jgi:hypothetical protein
VLAI